MDNKISLTTLQHEAPDTLGYWARVSLLSITVFPVMTHKGVLVGEAGGARGGGGGQSGVLGWGIGWEVGVLVEGERYRKVKKLFQLPQRHKKISHSLPV